LKIIPPKEIKYLPNFSDLDESFVPLCDLVFIIDRFIDSKIFPQKYKIIYSSSFDNSILTSKALENFNRLKVKLSSGDISVNKLSAGFLPKSAKNYLLDYYGSIDKRRYIVDFTNQFFGIKHFHLDSYDRSKDILLYYAISKDKIIFLKIGNHNDLYKQELVENLINEFPEIIGDLGIAKYPDMPVGDKYDYTIEKIKDTWISGGNITFHINNQYYTSCNPQTFSRLNAHVISQVQNIYYQVEENLKQFVSQLNQEERKTMTEFEIEPLRYETDQLYRGSKILIGEKNIKVAREIQIDYLRKLEALDMMINNNAL